MRVMARPQDDSAEGDASRATMVELKAVDGAYPLLGRIELSPPADLQALLRPVNGIGGAVAEDALIARLGLRPGERIRVGDALFELRAAIVREPDRTASVAAFGPRLIISLDALPATGLVQPGSLLRHATRVLLPPGEQAAAWMARARAAFPGAGWRIRDPAEAAPGVDRFIDRLAMFLGFAGMTALLIGGLGVANAVHTYLDGKTATIATLKCVGAPGGVVMTTYLLQILVLAGIGIVLGLLVGGLLPLALFGLIEKLLPIRIAFGVYPAPLATAALLGPRHRTHVLALAARPRAPSAGRQPLPPGRRRHQRPAGPGNYGGDGGGGRGACRADHRHRRQSPVRRHLRGRRRRRSRRSPRNRHRPRRRRAEGAARTGRRHPPGHGCAAAPGSTDRNASSPRSAPA